MEYEDYSRKFMGTESVGPLLRSLVRMVRPKRILEIGAGYTTPFLLEGLEKNEELFDDDSGNLNKEYAKNHKKNYDPKLVIIDDMRSMDKIFYDGFKKDFNISSKYVEFIEGKFQGKSQKLFDTYGLFDFVWFDCGGADEYIAFMQEYWNICSDYVFFHHTYSFQLPNDSLSIILGLAIGNPQHIDILEPHKDRQGSVTMLKKCFWDVRN